MNGWGKRAYDGADPVDVGGLGDAASNDDAAEDVRYQLPFLKYRRRTTSFESCTSSPTAAATVQSAEASPAVSAAEWSGMETLDAGMAAVSSRHRSSRRRWTGGKDYESTSRSRVATHRLVKTHVD